MIAGAIQIGSLSERSGISIDTIRFYEKQRLIQSPRRSEGGFRLFRDEDVTALRFIKSAQELGFSLDEIRELLSLRQDGAKACPRMQHLLQRKLTSVGKKIASLRIIESELKAALRKCNSALKGTPVVDQQVCPVLDEISAMRRKRNA